MIVLMGYIHLKPSDVQEFLADLQTIAAGTRAERGCLFYASALEDASSGRMLLVERWLDEDALTAHLHGPNAASFQQKWANRTRVDVQRYEVFSEQPLAAKHSRVHG